jgi:type IV secretory pathway TrbL component
MVASAHLPVRIRRKEVRLNVSFKEAMIRFGLTLALPILMLLVDARLIIYTAPVMAYLFLSGMTHFCAVKYLWHRVIKHEPPPPLPPYGENPNYPEESV